MIRVTCLHLMDFVQSPVLWRFFALIPSSDTFLSFSLFHVGSRNLPHIIDVLRLHWLPHRRG